MRIYSQQKEKPSKELTQRLVGEYQSKTNKTRMIELINDLTKHHSCLCGHGEWCEYCSPNSLTGQNDPRLTELKTLIFAEFKHV